MATKVEKPTLFFVYMKGCGHCAEMKPLLRAFRDANPDIVVKSLDIETTDWKARNWQPDVTPTLIALKPSGKWAKIEGQLDEAEFYGWVAKHL
jgi:thioredoxin-like negative regulator of GroEL